MLVSYSESLIEKLSDTAFSSDKMLYPAVSFSYNAPGFSGNYNYAVLQPVSGYNYTLRIADSLNAKYEAAHNRQASCNLWLAIASLDRQDSDYTSALYAFHKAMDYCYEKHAALIAFNAGNTALDADMPMAALQAFQKARIHATNPAVRYLSSLHMALIYATEGDSINAWNYTQVPDNWENTISNPLHKAYIQHLRGLTYQKTGKTEEAGTAYLAAMLYWKGLSDTMYALSAIELSRISAREGDSKKANKLLSEAEFSENTFIKSYRALTIADILFRKEAYTEAGNAALNAYEAASRNHFNTLALKACYLLSDIGLKTGNKTDYMLYRSLALDIIEEKPARKPTEVTGMTTPDAEKAAEMPSEKDRLEIRNWFVALISLLFIAVGIMALILNRNRLKQKRRNELLSSKNSYIAKQNKDLNAYNKHKTQLLSVIAHDLRGPIGHIKRLIDFLLAKETNLEKESQLILRSIKNSSISSYNLLENLLVWARNEKGDIPFNPEMVPAEKLIQSSVEVFWSIADSKKIGIEITAANDDEVYCDAAMITTVLRNLLSNAIKYTRAEGTVHMSAKRKNWHIEFSVSDTGIGMSGEMQEKLQSDETFFTEGTEGEESSGFGLQLCKNFLARHHSKLKVKSAKDEGSRFYFRLPAEKQEF